MVTEWAGTVCLSCVLGEWPADQTSAQRGVPACAGGAHRPSAGRCSSQSGAKRKSENKHGQSAGQTASPASERSRTFRPVQSGRLWHRLAVPTPQLRTLMLRHFSTSIIPRGTESCRLDTEQSRSGVTAPGTKDAIKVPRPCLRVQQFSSCHTNA